MTKELNGKRNASLRVSEAMGLISPLINIGQFKDDAARVLDDYHMDAAKKMVDTAEGIAEELGVAVETVHELEAVCSTSKLECAMENDVVNWDDVQEVPTNTGLETVNAWRDICLKRNQDVAPLILKSKYTKYSCQLEDQVREKRPKHKKDIVKCPESVLTVAVNFPRTYRRFKHCSVNFRVLGSQKLTELRDIIPCAIDEQPVGQFTDNPDHPRDIKCKDLFQSGFFFIENTFFNDFRNPSNSDLSKHITEWAENHGITMDPECKSVRMDDYTFDDLDLHLGSPYLYMHQGDCEHIIIFKDIRLFHPDDCKARSAYPLAISRARFKTPTCKVCSFFFATWMTRFDELSDEDPSFFCENCFRMLHYNKDGSRAAEFEAFPFISRESVDY